MPKPRARRRIEKRPLASLKPHPQQAELFDDLNEVELQLLADDLKKDGLNHSVEILPNGVIIAGHQRVAAAKLLGWKEIRCWVRDDLEQMGDDAVEERLIGDNLNRRQLSPLAVARCYLRLKEIERDGYHAAEEARGDLRDHLAERFGVDGRTLDRYARMLTAPVVVQYSFERGQLTQNQVLAVVGLDADQQQEIAERIEDGEEQKSVVKEYLAAGANDPSPLTSVSRLVRALDRGLSDLKKRYKRIRGVRSWDHELRVLQEAEKFIPALRHHLDQQNASSKQEPSRPAEE